MNHDELESLTATETVRLVKSKQVSATEVTQAAIRRIESRNPALNAVIYKDFEGAQAYAHNLDTRIARGEPVGKLAGVPTLMKDLFDFKPGWPSTLGGIPALKNFVPDFWSTYPQRVEQQDAILLGKTNTPVLGFNGATDNPLFGPASNPFDLSLNSGGSSGGSAAAVAAGLVPVAGGSDGGGSIRIPSACCGTAGFQPSYGRVPLVIRPNAFGGVSPFVYEGPIARTVDDLALLMSILSGYEASDPFSNPEKVDFLSCLQTPSLKGKRIGYTRNFGIFPVDPAIADCVDKAISAFADAGAIVEEIDLVLPYSQQELSDLWCRLITAGSCSILMELQRNGIDLLRNHHQELPEALQYWMQVTRNQSFADMQADQNMRSRIFDTFATAFSKVDLIVSPTLAAFPQKNLDKGLTTGPSAVNGISVNPQIGWCMTYLTNMTGHPAASVPAGMAQGLPVGLQIMGRRYADLDVMQACACFERERPWVHLYDALAPGLVKSTHLDWQG